MQLLVHEYLHNDDDTGSHEHDHAFYEAFHEAMLDHGDDWYSIAAAAFDAHYRNQARKSKKLARQADCLRQQQAYTAEPGVVAA